MLELFFATLGSSRSRGKQKKIHDMRLILAIVGMAAKANEPKPSFWARK